MKMSEYGIEASTSDQSEFEAAQSEDEPLEMRLQLSWIVLKTERELVLEVEEDEY